MFKTFYAIHIVCAKENKKHFSIYCYQNTSMYSKASFLDTFRNPTKEVFSSKKKPLNKFQFKIVVVVAIVTSHNLFKHF